MSDQILPTQPDLTQPTLPTQPMAARPVVNPAHYQPCEECGALLDSQQRYCVNCAARRANGSNPSSRYFAAMSKRSRRQPARQPQKPSGSRAAAVGFFALLPIAVALGVVVGHSGSSNNDQAILEALRRQDAAAASTSAAGNATASTKKNAGAAKKAGSASGKGHSKILANTPDGPIHQALGYVPTKHETKVDTELVKKNAKEVGKNYSKAEQNLPDVIVVGK